MDATEFSGEKYSDSLISGDNNTPWASLSDRLKQLLVGNIFIYFLTDAFVASDLHFRGRKSENFKKDGVVGIFWNPIFGHGFPMEKESLAQKIYHSPLSCHPLWLKR